MLMPFFGVCFTVLCWKAERVQKHATSYWDARTPARNWRLSQSQLGKIWEEWMKERRKDRVSGFLIFDSFDSHCPAGCGDQVRIAKVEILPIPKFSELRVQTINIFLNLFLICLVSSFIIALWKPFLSGRFWWSIYPPLDSGSNQLDLKFCLKLQKK